MGKLPSVHALGIDSFEEKLRIALKDATPEEMRDGAVRAGRYIETQAERAGLDMDKVNNATSLLCGLVRRLTLENEKLRGQPGTCDCCTGNECECKGESVSRS